MRSSSFLRRGSLAGLKTSRLLSTRQARVSAPAGQVCGTRKESTFPPLARVARVVRDGRLEVARKLGAVLHLLRLVLNHIDIPLIPLLVKLGAERSDDPWNVDFPRVGYRHRVALEYATVSA